MTEQELKGGVMDFSMVESGDGVHAICLDKNDARQYGWIFYRGGQGQWVTLRRALPQELQRAERHIEFVKSLLGLECKE